MSYWKYRCNLIAQGRFITLCHILRMNKYTRVLQNIVIFTTFFTVWIIGSTIMIQIDSERTLEYINWDKNINLLSNNIDSYCARLKNKSQIEFEDQMGIEDEGQMLLKKAQKYKLVKENLLLFPELQQMWCLVPKAASTSWSKTIIDALNSKHLRLYIDEEEKSSALPLQVILKQNYGNINKLVFEDAIRSNLTKKILLARHPFHRIVSAFEDKLNNRKARKDGMYFFQHYGVKINRKFRNNKRMKKKEPTFTEFVDYLVHTDPMSYDEHWKPLSLLCGTCQVKYDLIIKVEDLKSTTEFYLKKLGLPITYDFPHKNGFENTKNVMDYFKNISKSKILQLFKIYQDDFQLLQYGFLDYYITGYYQKRSEDIKNFDLNK